MSAIPTPPQIASQLPFPRDISPCRVDLHCHSVASTEADEAVLAALQCPECFSEPHEVAAQARQRGMNFITITDHDSIEGVIRLGERPDVIVGEELTCYFPEDRCKMHVLVWGITRSDHDALQDRAADIYAVAAYIESHGIAHSVAHALYRQNDLLERWHLERLILMFKGFECLNGAHSLLHQQALEPVLDALTPERIARLSSRHGIPARWPEPWKKSRTGGSDDHGLFNIGRTWTEFPPDVSIGQDVLRCLREARCRPGGEAGSSLKLAHNFFGVGIRHFTRNIAPSAARTPSGSLLQLFVGDRRRFRKRDMLRAALGGSARAVGRQVMRPFGGRRQVSGTALFGELFLRSFQTRASEREPLAAALGRGLAPLGEHEDVFRLACAINRDVIAGILNAAGTGAGRGDLAPLFDSISALAVQQFTMIPYYFAMFHQNRERDVLHRITGSAAGQSRPSRIGLFTDTLDEPNEVSRFLDGLARHAADRGRDLVIHACSVQPKLSTENRKYFEAVASGPLPFSSGNSVSLPPVAEVLEWADRQQFDAIHISTPGPMGLCGWLVAKMLRVPMLATFHTDWTVQVRGATGDHRLTQAASGYSGWFYRQVSAVFIRNRAYREVLQKLQVSVERITALPPVVDTTTFTPRQRDIGVWERIGVVEPCRLLYAGRIGREKNLGLLADIFRQICSIRQDVALVIAGDGPDTAALREALAGLPAHFTGALDERSLSTLYASADLFVHPSRIDAPGQAIVEAQACGLPVLVGDEGNPAEVMDDGIGGLILPARDPAAWVKAIDDLLDDVPRRLRMARTAPQRINRPGRPDAYELFWNSHLDAIRALVPSTDTGADANADAATAPAMEPVLP